MSKKRECCFLLYSQDHPSNKYPFDDNATTKAPEAAKKPTGQRPVLQEASINGSTFKTRTPLKRPLLTLPPKVSPLRSALDKPVQSHSRKSVSIKKTMAVQNDAPPAPEPWSPKTELRAMIEQKMSELKVKRARENRKQEGMTKWVRTNEG